MTDERRVEVAAQALLATTGAWPRTGGPSDDAHLAALYARAVVAALDAVLDRHAPTTGETP